MAVQLDHGPIALGGSKQRAVLAALLVEPGRSLNVDELAERVWADDIPPRYQTSIQAYVSNLRRLLEPARSPRQPATVLVSRSTGYAMVVDEADVDVTQFTALATHAHRQRRERHDPRAVLAELDRALSLWSGPLLPELSGRDWVDIPAAALGHARLQALLAKAELLIETGDPIQSLTTAQAVLADSPYDEHAHAVLAVARYQLGQQRDALAGLVEARRLLHDDIGIEPGPLLQATEQDILHHRVDVRSLRGDPHSVERRPPPSAQPTTEIDRALPSPPTERPFVGRAGELDRLAGAWAATRAGRGRFAVVSGVAGVGKSRLVEEFVRSDEDRRVAWGRCPESSAQASYWVLSQIVRQLEGAALIDAVPLTKLAAASLSAGFEVFDQRWAFYRATLEALSRVTQPVTVVIDDLHWADPASLRLVGFLAAEIRSVPLLVVVIARPPHPDDAVELAECLAAIGRQATTVRIELGGLTTADIDALLTATMGRRPAAEVVESVFDRTAGNAFFVGEIAGLLSRGEAPSGVPATVSDVVRGRILNLPATTAALLKRASIIGREFRVDILADVAERDQVAVLDGLTPAFVAGLIEEDAQPGTLRFVHSIVADALISTVGSAERARVHAAVARALVARGAGTVEESVSAIAHHAFAGLAAGSGWLAHEWSVRCARLAASWLGDEDAAFYWGRAAEAAAAADPARHRERLEALVEQGRASLRLDDVVAAVNALVPAIELALDRDDDVALAMAVEALDIPGFWRAGEIGGLTVDVASVLERAAQRLPPASPALAVAYGSLADFGYRSRSTDHADSASAEAVRVARATGDVDVLTLALHRRAQATWRTKDMSLRRQAVAELETLAGDARVAGVLRAYAGFDAAAVAWADGDVERAAQLLVTARRIAPPSVTVETQFQFFESAIALWRGHLDRAAALANSAYDVYRSTRRWAAEEFRSGFLSSILLEQDLLDQALATAEVLTVGPYAGVFSELAVFVMLEAGERRLAEQTVRPLPPDVDSWMFPAVMSLAAHNRARLGDVAAAVEAARRLEPLSGRLAATGTGVAFGAVDQARAAAFWVAGQADRAEQAIGAAIELLDRSGSGPWLVRALAFAAVITGRADSLDRARQVAGRRQLPLLTRTLGPPTR